MQTSYLFLGVAIVSETIATTAMKASEGFTRLWPSVLTAAGYACAFYFLSRTLAAIPTGVAYAIWSGVGTVLIAFLGWLVYGQTLDAAALLGIGLIVAGVVLLTAVSSSGTH